MCVNTTLLGVRPHPGDPLTNSIPLLIKKVAKISPINEKGINKLWKLLQTFSVIKSSRNLRKQVLIASILSATALLKIFLTEHLRSKRKTLCRSVDYRVGLNKKQNLTQCKHKVLVSLQSVSCLISSKDENEQLT